MNMHEKYTGRSVIYRNGDTIKITIPSKRSWFVVILLAFWLVCWTAVESSTAERLVNVDGRLGAKTFLAVCLTAWTAFGIIALYGFLWLIGGREIVTINSGVLKLRKQIFGLGTIKHYPISDITRMKACSPRTRRSDRRKIKRGVIEFYSKGKIIKFGADLDLTEAEILVETFKQNRNFRETNFE
jgi:hypothetical protein